jgi:murein DD-endopeptidase MepM/ murein hydrolase activator NlpD
VESTTRGIVWSVGRNRLGGNVVFVLGPGRELHYYAHLDRFADVHPGMRVEAGTVLGYVGNTGNAKGGPTHLHYGVYPAGRGAIDPYPRLVAGASAGAALHANGGAAGTVTN